MRGHRNTVPAILLVGGRRINDFATANYQGEPKLSENGVCVCACVCV